LSVHDFILPLFVSEKLDHRRPITSMPGVFQLSMKEIANEARAAQDLGLPCFLAFPNRKTNRPRVLTLKMELFKKRCGRSNQNVRSWSPSLTSACANT